jgi:hypothetical protein
LGYIGESEVRDQIVEASVYERGVDPCFRIRSASLWRHLSPTMLGVYLESRTCVYISMLSAGLKVEKSPDLIHKGASRTVAVTRLEPKLGKSDV